MPRFVYPDPCSPETDEVAVAALPVFGAELDTFEDVPRPGGRRRSSYQGVFDRATVAGLQESVASGSGATLLSPSTSAETGAGGRSSIALPLAIAAAFLFIAVRKS